MHFVKIARRYEIEEGATNMENWEDIDRAGSLQTIFSISYVCRNDVQAPRAANVSSSEARMSSKAPKAAAITPLSP
jgi:hypothetical protein